MLARSLPVRPELDELRREAEDLHRSFWRGASEMDDVEPRPGEVVRASGTLADARNSLAQGYGVPSWERLVRACHLVDAIWRDDIDQVRDLIVSHPQMLHENARGTDRCNWGPPMSYAANLGRDRIIAMLHGLGAKDQEKAMARALLQSQIETARMLHALAGNPEPGRGAVLWAAETLSAVGFAYALELGAEICDWEGDWRGPVAMVLETYSRAPEGKHGILEQMVERGIDLPDTPTMAVHRGRIELLQRHLDQDPNLLGRTFSHEEIYPPELGCHSDPTLALHGTPLAGTTLLHLCIDYDEVEPARWLIDHGADVNARGDIDGAGLGGHTPLFGCVVSQPYRVGLRKDDDVARLLLDHGADLNARASLGKRLQFVEDDSWHEYRDVTPLSWGERFHDQGWVSPSVMWLLRERGGLA